MLLDLKTGLLDGVKYLPSPNCDERPVGTVIDLLVIHGISLPPGEFGGNAIDALFMNKLDPNEHPYFREVAHLRVSSHALIRRDGQITQYVSFIKRAWHAGESIFEGRPQCNNFSIGIELEGTDTLPYEPIQYLQLADLTTVIRQAYRAITLKRIIGHCDIAPGRKTDPGSVFNWSYFYSLLTK